MKKADSKNRDSEFEKILTGLDATYEKMVRFKRYKKSPIIVSKGGKIVKLDPFKVKPKLEKSWRQRFPTK